MTKRVLVVEDDAFQAMDIEDAVLAGGFEAVGPADSADSAIELARTKKPDYAILDFNLHGSNSQPVAETLMKMEIPFVYVTGRTRQELDKAGVPDCVVFAKPVATEKLMAHISEELFVV